MQGGVELFTLLKKFVPRPSAEPFQIERVDLHHSDVTQRPIGVWAKRRPRILTASASLCRPALGLERFLYRRIIVAS